MDVPVNTKKKKKEGKIKWAKWKQVKICIPDTTIAS